MKREALRHPKMYDLADRLGCSRVEAIGYLTLLFDFAADQALAGNVGKWADGAIARACEWSGDSTVFVTALIDARWLDRDEEYRLLIHDWAEHAKQWMKQKASKSGVTMISRPAVTPAVRPAVATVVPTEPPLTPDPVATVSRDQTFTNQTSTNLEITPAKPVVRVEYGADFEEWWKVYPRREGKGYAQKKFLMALKGLALRPEHGSRDKAFEWLMMRTRLFAESPRGRGDKQFIPHPGTWLEGPRYDDDEAEWMQAGGSRQTQTKLSIDIDAALEASKNDHGRI